MPPDALATAPAAAPIIAPTAEPTGPATEPMIAPVPPPAIAPILSLIGPPCDFDRPRPLDEPLEEEPDRDPLPRPPPPLLRPPDIAERPRLVLPRESDDDELDLPDRPPDIEEDLARPRPPPPRPPALLLPLRLFPRDPDRLLDDDLLLREVAMVVPLRRPSPVPCCAATVNAR